MKAKEEILEGNKLIAEFDNYEQVPEGCSAKFYRYDSQWDWLIPVVEKINRIDYENRPTDKVIDDFAGLRTFTNSPKPMVRFNRGQLFEADTLIEATWLAVVDFIKYNNQTN